jgi:hypothetical protein
MKAGRVVQALVHDTSSCTVDDEFKRMDGCPNNDLVEHRPATGPLPLFLCMKLYASE